MNNSDRISEKRNYAAIYMNTDRLSQTMEGKERTPEYVAEITGGNLEIIRRGMAAFTFIEDDEDQ